MDKEKRRLKALPGILLVVTAVGMFNLGSYAIPSFQDYIADEVYEDELLITDMTHLALCAVCFILIVLFILCGKPNLLLPAAVLFVIEEFTFSWGEPSIICSAILCVICFCQAKDESRDWISIAALLLYGGMLCYQILELVYTAAVYLTDDREPVVPVLLSILVVVLLAVSIKFVRRKGDAIWLKYAAAFYLVQYVLQVVRMTFTYGAEASFEDSLLLTVFNLFVMIFVSPDILLSIYLLIRKKDALILH
ncbi:hypothetical protein NE619_11815 [Anaerovorax odorimutans]|uniref:Uncharacterized protein n=1 Tax=Anaerovorax odorimutans TaxID=109327 RepID=A0ABT1RQD9_9FIRM|nr:hypothetical protein [Anaerovorax odorimutans]MCQ4637412.1 hypothetical protein [Anaerovorax odorimutans]